MFAYYALAVIAFLIIYYLVLKHDHSNKEPPGMQFYFTRFTSYIQIQVALYICEFILKNLG